MGYFSWMAQVAELSAPGLTLRAQQISPNDTGKLLWDAFAPRRDVDSINLAELNANIDFRPVSDRREWNTRGRLIPLRTPATSLLEMVPIESYFKLGEYEIQKLEERADGNDAQIRRAIGVTIPERTDGLASANYRRVDVDWFTAWALGQITARNPVSGTAVTVSYNFAAARYETAGVAWSGAVNAYNEFMAWIARATDLVGAIKGVMIRTSTYNLIKAAAPNPFNNSAVAIAVTRNQLEQRIQDELGSPFQFYINELQQDIFGDGGTDVTRTKVWAANRVAAIPVNEQIGTVAFAPIARAMQLARSIPDAKIDVRGNSVFPEEEGNGRGLNVECQLNAFPTPVEANLAVIDAGA